MIAVYRRTLRSLSEETDKKESRESLNDGKCMTVDYGGCRTARLQL